MKDWYEKSKLEDLIKKHLPKRFQDLYKKISAELDNAYSNKDYEKVDDLEEKLEILSEKMENYLSGIFDEDYNVESDYEPDEHGGGMGQSISGGIHYNEEIPPLYEGYLLSKMGIIVSHFFDSEEDDLYDKLAESIFESLVSSGAINSKDYLTYDENGSIMLDPKKKSDLVNFGKRVWEDRVKLLKRINPDWSGYHGYFDVLKSRRS